MLIDLFNAFDPVRFLIDAPLWVSFVAPGITYIITLSAIYALLRVVLGRSGAAEGLTLAAWRSIYHWWNHLDAKHSN